MLERLLEAGVITKLDLHFARFLAGLSGEGAKGAKGAGLLLAAALVSRRSSEGHTCLDLGELAGITILDSDTTPIRCPELAEWERILLDSGLAGRPGESLPLILDGSGRLYLQRYRRHEEFLAQRILVMLDSPVNVNMTRLKQGLERLFPGGNHDLQKLAAMTSVLKRFCLISGGPGTGKTYTVVKILILLQLQQEQEGGEELRARDQDQDQAAKDSGTLSVALAAPTGKAAARLEEAVRAGMSRLSVKDLPWPAISNAMTVHRLIGNLSYGTGNVPDVVVIDEVSMADLRLMSALLARLPATTRMIWLGDKDQLSSVEAGAVLGDVCGESANLGYSSRFCETARRVTGISLRAEDGVPPVRDCIVILDKSYRFSEESALANLSRSVNSSAGEQALALLQRNRDKSLSWIDQEEQATLMDRLRERIVNGFSGYVRSEDPGEVFRAFNTFRVLCAHRKGRFGVEVMGRWIERLLEKEGLLNPYRNFYDHRPVLINRNDYNQGLFNGDVGIILPDKEAGGKLTTFFQDLKRGGFFKVPPLLLPEHETAYAMTVHKSQGSEFREVLLLLPAVTGRILTREVIYTAITRAREQLSICGSTAVFLEALVRRIRRESGLRDALWQTGQTGQVGQTGQAGPGQGSKQEY